MRGFPSLGIYQKSGKDMLQLGPLMVSMHHYPLKFIPSPLLTKLSANYDLLLKLRRRSS